MCDRRRGGSTLVKNSMTYFMDAPKALIHVHTDHKRTVVAKIKHVNVNTKQCMSLIIEQVILAVQGLRICVKTA